MLKRRRKSGQRRRRRLVESAGGRSWIGVVMRKENKGSVLEPMYLVMALGVWQRIYEYPYAVYHNGHSLSCVLERREIWWHVRVPHQFRWQSGSLAFYCRG